MLRTSFFLAALFACFSCTKTTTTTCSNSLNPSSCLDNSITIDTSKINRKVLIIGVDGFRSNAMQEEITPFLFQLSQSPKVFFNSSHRTEDYTISGPNWSSILTGVHWCKHQVIDNSFTDNQLQEFPHFFRYIQNADSSIRTASVVNWTPINEYLAFSIADYSPTESITDEMVYQQSVDLLQNQTPISPDILFLHFDNPDAAGHGHGFSPEVAEYSNTLTQTDLYIEQLFSIIESKRSNGEDWLIFIVSDHGGDGTGHSDGQDNPCISNTVFFAQHPNLQFKPNQLTSQVDLTPSILDFMGIYSQEFNCKTDGSSIFQ